MSVNTASAIWPLRSGKIQLKEPLSKHKHFHRPMPIRTRTFSLSPSVDASPDSYHASFRSRHKSVPSNEAFGPAQARNSPTVGEHESPRTSSEDSVGAASDVVATASPPSSPSTVMTDGSSKRSSLEMGTSDSIPYDFSRVDYELERAKVLGQGLWSTVFLAEHKDPAATTTGKPTSKSHRLRNLSGPSLFAVKTPSRRDSPAILSKEAKVLSYIQRHHGSAHFIVPFYGLDSRNNSLVFEAVIGGSLDTMMSRLKQMTELARHLEIVNLFPSLVSDLVCGLEFLHSAGVVHADIKPANILLDISHYPSPSHDNGAPVIRARYIDFSAAFIPSHPLDPQLASSSNAGGTWDFMAPEQLRIQADLNTPTPASDVWSLGVTLLAVLVGGSPFADAVAPGNLFMLREAVKTGDPLAFARADSVARKRLAACQDFVDCLRLALKKDRDIRVTAAAWRRWIEEREMGS